MYVHRWCKMKIKTLWNISGHGQAIGCGFPCISPHHTSYGTPIYDDAIRNGHITEEDFDNFDWLTPVLDSDYMTKDEIAWELYRMNQQLSIENGCCAVSFPKWTTNATCTFGSPRLRQWLSKPSNNGSTRST